MTTPALVIPENKIAKGSMIACFLVCVGWYIRETVILLVPVLPGGSDFTAYHEAARNILAGQSPFRTGGYIYPPLLAFALTPLAPLSYANARYVWFGLSQVCLLTAGWLIWRAMGKNWLAAASVAFVWALGQAAQENLAWGQPGSELTLLAALAMTQAVDGKDRRAALAVASGAALKVFPAVWAALFLLRRQWSRLAISAGVAALLVALPWLLVTCCLDGPRAPGATDTWSGTPSVLSWGIPSVVLRALDPPVRGGPLPRDWDTQLPDLRLPPSHRWSSIAAACATLAGGLAMLAAALRRNPSLRQDGFAVAALISLSLAASPVCWYHYQELQYPGVALLLCHLLRSQRWVTGLTVVALGALLCAAPLGAITAYYAKYGSLTASLPTLYFWTSVSPVASIALFGLFLRELRPPSI
jgi:hypothetical protein